MPAYFDTGFSVRQPMWHGQGLVLDEYPDSWDDARIKSGLTWEPRAVPAYAKRRFPVDFELTAGCIVIERDDEFVTAFVPLEDHKLIERDDTGSVLGVVGDGFELVMHAEMGEILEAIVGEGAKFETAGSCRGGAQVWALAYLDEPLSIAHDDTDTYPFIALLNAHDGSGACKLTNSSIRVVCWNTYQMTSLEGERTGRQFTFRHTASVHERIDEAKAALSGLRDETAQWSELATELFGMPVSDVVFNHFLADFIPEPAAEIVSDRVRANVDKARTIFRSLYFDSLTTEAHRGTALGVIDTAVEYLDHVRGYRNSDTYLGRTLLRPEPLKARATMLIREHCSA